MEHSRSLSLLIELSFLNLITENFHIFCRKTRSICSCIHCNSFFPNCLAPPSSFATERCTQRDATMNVQWSAYLRVGWLGQRKRVSVTRELERTACIRNSAGRGSRTRIENARSRASGTRTTRRYRVAFHVIKRRARLGRRVTRSTTRLSLPTRARNVSDRALGRTESWLFSHTVHDDISWTLVHYTRRITNDATPCGCIRFPCNRLTLEMQPLSYGSV